MLGQIYKCDTKGILCGARPQERKLFDDKFVRLDTRRLCELTSAADALDMKPLVDLTSKALARLIEGKTPEQARAGDSAFPRRYNTGFGPAIVSPGVAWSTRSPNPALPCLQDGRWSC